jgi:uncharacterized protein
MGPCLDGRSEPPRSLWARAGQPLPFLPYSQDWKPDTTSLRPLVRAQPAMHLERAAEAAIPIERFAGRPRCRRRRPEVGRPPLRSQPLGTPGSPRIVDHPAKHLEAGHRARLSGDASITEGQQMQPGGQPASRHRARGAGLAPGF